MIAVADVSLHAEMARAARRIAVGEDALRSHASLETSDAAACYDMSVSDDPHDGWFVTTCTRADNAVRAHQRAIDRSGTLFALSWMGVACTGPLLAFAPPVFLGVLTAAVLTTAAVRHHQIRAERAADQCDSDLRACLEQERLRLAALQLSSRLDACAHEDGAGVTVEERSVTVGTVKVPRR